MTWLLLAAAGFAAGVINAIAGGGSLLSFPALLLTGMPPVTANATNTLAVWPGTVSSAWAYRKLIGEERDRAWGLAVPSVLGGLGGSALLLHTPESAFRAVVPWLILFACALVALQEPIARFLLSHRRTGSGPPVPPALWVAQLAISIYGGYFGAGMGILMQGAMGILIPATFQQVNALKLLLATVINGAAVVWFLAAGAARLPVAVLMAAAAVAGGWAGALLAQRLPVRVLRAIVVLYGAAVAIRMLLLRWSAAAAW